MSVFFILGINLHDVKAETINLHGWLSEEKGGEAMGNARYGQKFYVCFEITGSESGTNISKYEGYTIKYTLTKPDGTKIVSQASNRQKACWGVYNPQLGRYEMKLHLEIGGTEVDCNLGIDCIDVVPLIISHASSVMVSPGDKATYSIMAAGTHNNYQWYKNGIKLEGATSSSYTTSTLYSSNNGDYYTCSVSNKGNSTIYSNKAYCYVRGYPTTPKVDLISNGRLLTNDEWATYQVYIAPKGSQLNGYGSVLYQYSWDKNTWYTSDLVGYAQDTAQRNIYVRAINKEDQKLMSSIVTCSFKKDGTKPQIQTVYADSEKALSSKIYEKGISDNLSGIAHISISENRDIYKWETNTESEYKKEVKKNGIYYIAVRDKAGNISEIYECSVNNIIEKSNQQDSSKDQTTTPSQPGTSGQPTSSTTATPKEDNEIYASSKTVTYKSKSFYLNVKTKGNGELSYGSSNKKVVTIGKNGRVTPVGYGETTISIHAHETERYKEAFKNIKIFVVPKKITLKKVTSPKKNCIKVKWGKDKTVTGYQMMFSKKKNFKNSTFTRWYKQKQSAMSGMGLNSKKTYYFKIRAYKTVGKKKLYGAWSSVKKVKIK